MGEGVEDILSWYPLPEHSAVHVFNFKLRYPGEIQLYSWDHDAKRFLLIISTSIQIQTVKEKERNSTL